MKSLTERDEICVCKSKNIIFDLYPLNKQNRCKYLPSLRTNAPTPCLPFLSHNITWYPINIPESTHIEHLMCMRLLNALVPQGKRALTEDLSTVLKTTLLVLAAVDEVGVVEGKLNSTVDNVVDSLYTQHERVVLVTDLVAP